MARYSRFDLLNYHPDKRFYDPYYSNREEQMVTPYSNQANSFGKFAVGSVGIGYGSYKVAQLAGINLFDPLYKGVRTVEEFSPGKVFRTFQAGNFLSQFTSQGRADLNIPAELIKTDSEWFRDLSHRAIGNVTKATTEGLQFSKGQLWAGDELLLKNSTKMINVGNPYLSAAYSRSLGFQGLPNPDTANLLRIDLPIPGTKSSSSVFFTGAETKGRAIGNQLKAIVTESAFERVNRLADAPFGVEPFSTGLGRVREVWEKTFGTRFTLAVRSGSAPEMLGRMATKWGILGTAATLTYLTVDKAVRDSSIFDGSIFSQGITAGIATVGIKANLAAAKVADFVPGVRAYQQKQEEIAPGSTSLTKLLAFPAAGALAGGTAHYATGTFEKIKATRSLMKSGLSYTEAIVAAEEQVHALKSAITDNKFTSLLKGKFGKHIPYFGEITRGKAFAITGIGLGLLAAAPFLPGALIPGKSETELQDIYSGRQEVAVRKSRFWELGKTPFEGNKVDYYRPHWFPRMLQRGKETSMYGEDSPSAWHSWIEENFTYNMERQHYRDRPYPITGAAFEDVPIIGPMLSATIGKLIKPQLLMHTDEWQGERGSVLYQPGRLGAGPGDGGLPSTPDFKNALGEQAYRLTELSGLTGFTFSSIKEMITGEDEFFDQQTRLQSARDMYSARRSFWDLNMGGALFTNEFIRRMIPGDRKQISEYNPIRNTMPNWLPGPSDRSPDFLHGDPFALIQEGEIRLPGEGYATRFPELKGVDPADYPLIHRYKILTDIAPYSVKTQAITAEMTGLAKAGRLSDEELALFMQTKRQQPSRSENKRFYDFDIIGESPDIELPESLGITQSRSTISAINKTLALKEERGTVSSILGGYWEALAKAIQGPLETVTPLAPGAKLLDMKSAIQDYKETQVFGPQMAIWQTPWKSFFKPFIEQTADLFGAADIPNDVQRKRSIEEYFDVLKYIKNTRLANESKELGIGEAVGAYSRAANETLVGVNPYTRDGKTLFRSMPRNERDYFSAFVGADSKNEREEILSLVSPSMRRVYSAQWEQRYIDLLGKEVEKGNISAEEAEPLQKAFWNKRSIEGLPVNDDLIDQYKNEKSGDLSYANWFRANILIPQVAAEEGIPGPDWVGFNPTVDLDEIKLKVVKNEGMNIHDFNLWLSDEKAAAQDPYLDDAANELMNTISANEDRSPQQIQGEVREMLDELGINAQVYSYNTGDGKYFDIDSADDRKQSNYKLKKRLEELEQ